jgi:hypothetical protein
VSRWQALRGLGIGLDLAEQWTLNRVQWEFVACDRRFSFYIGGVGAGKTYAGAVRAIVRAVDYPGSLGLIGAPTYTMLRDATQRTFFELLPEEYIQAYNKAEGHLTLHNGSEILFRSLDQPDRVRGLNLAWFWLDEAPLCGYYAWQVLKGRLRQRGFATAGWATGTPRGRDGFARDFELERRRNRALFRASTYANAHNLPADYVAELGYTGAFHDQEVLGRFTAFEGLVYVFDTGPSGHIREVIAEDAKEDAAFLKGEETMETGETDPTSLRPSRTFASFAFPPSSASSASVSASSALNLWKAVIGGIDWGYSNPAAAVVFGIDGDGRAWQLDEFYQRRAALEEALLPGILELTRRYGVATWYCGPDEPEHIARLAEALAREGLRARAIKADNAVQPGIQTVTSLLALRPDGTRGLYVSPRCVHTIAEYQSYQYATGREADTPSRFRGGGKGERSELPLKQNDHALDATRYALHTALGQRRATVAYLASMRRQPRDNAGSCGARPPEPGG